MTDKTFDILVFADACVDLILRDDDVRPQFGQVEKLVADYELVMGGSCCIFAAAGGETGGCESPSWVGSAMTRRGD